jgi:hypothetical protein
MKDVRGIIIDIAESDEPDKLDRIASIMLIAGRHAESVALEFLARVAESRK